MAGKGKGFRIFSNIIMVLLSFAAVMPFILLVVSSITKEEVIARYGYSFVPRAIDFAAYRYLFMSSNKIIKAYGMTFIVAFIGTTLNMLMTMFAGYLLSKRDLPGRNFISFFIFFTMLFSGGMVPSYIVWSRLMKVGDTIFGLICPNLMLSAFNIILMRTYFTSNIPYELCEAAEMDSCSEAGILFHICLPLSKPMIATLTLFSGLAYWNDWINGLYYLVRRKDLYTIQNVLNTMQSNVQFLKDNATASMGEFAQSIPSLGVRMAIAVISIIPIMVIYPFFQQYFVRGIVVGGVKG
ncbi:MAG: carbohydrate ABC transporter permease [Oscillospiraceae bacterium]|nr:carbohydrate ABC transporter permease [Oscillospiraceae bacterium]